MGKTVVTTEGAPRPVGPYSQAVKLETDLLFASGQLGVSPETGELAQGVAAQTEQALRNMEAVLHAAGGALESVLKTTVFLTNMSDFGSVNETYSRFFVSDPPARSCVAVAELPLGASVEIECIARV